MRTGPLVLLQRELLLAVDVANALSVIVVVHADNVECLRDNVSVPIAPLKDAPSANLCLIRRDSLSVSLGLLPYDEAP